MKTTNGLLVAVVSLFTVSAIAYPVTTTIDLKVADCTLQIGNQQVPAQFARSLSKRSNEDRNAYVQKLVVEQPFIAAVTAQLGVNPDQTLSVVELASLRLFTDDVTLQPISNFTYGAAVNGFAVWAKDGADRYSLNSKISVSDDLNVVSGSVRIEKAATVTAPTMSTRELQVTGTCK
ncbi:MAG: hypothetical protein EOP06_09535 [Proteobacteria bacterium]|nr:MAG: hypothetical protein EOP06_09535 [Pseudomonadota bacterium]